MNKVSHLNILVSWIPIHLLQILKIGIFHEIKLWGDEAHCELTKVINESTYLHQQYDIALQQKREFEGRVEEAMEDNNEEKERLRKDLKEKDEVDIMVQKTQAFI